MGAGGSSGTVRKTPQTQTQPEGGVEASPTLVCVQPKSSSPSSEPSEPEPESPRQQNRPQVLAWGDNSSQKEEGSPKAVSDDKAGKEDSSPHTAGGQSRSLENESQGTAANGSQSTAATGHASKAASESRAPGGAHLQGFAHAHNDLKGSLRPGQAVRICGLENATYLNGRQGVLRCWDADLNRWVVRLGNGEDKGIRSVNLAPVQGPSRGGAMGVDSASEQANKELEGLLLQTNWSAIYQLFYQRFGITVLEKLERGYAVKAAVEMSLSIVAKCFALLRSDPGGRLHCTPLHIAALQSSTEAAEVIVRDLPKLVEQTHKPSHSALCPLHIAILCGCQAIVELLLEGQADPNVRTLHDVCPMHLAATTSKELCQVLLSYNAEPLRRDVMGSTVVHYAAAFKQQAVVEFILGNATSPARLASEGDQKRVTPLHISCALYTSEEDMPTPLILMANGAKPWQADVSGATARDVVPWAPNSILQQFFEANGNQTQAAALQWTEQRRAKEENKQDLMEDSGSEGEGSNRASSRLRKHTEDPAMSEQESKELSPERSNGRVAPGTSMQESKGAANQSTEATSHAGSNSAATEADLSKVTAEIERLKAEHAAEVEQLKQELRQSVEKCTRLEESSAHQQKNFEALQKLGEETQAQHKSQLEDVQKRMAAERVDWDARLQSQLNIARGEARAEALKEAQQENATQIEQLKLSFSSQREELQAQLREAEAARDAALARPEGDLEPLEAQKADLIDLRGTLNGFGKTLKGITEDVRAGNEEAFKEQIRELTDELERLEKLQADEQAQRSLEIQTLQQQVTQAQEEAAALRSRNVEAQNEMQRVTDASKAEIAGLQGLSAANQEQVRALQQDAVQLRARCTEAEDRCQNLAQEKQNAESRLSAERIAFDTKIQDLEHQHMQASAQERSEAEAMKLRAEAAVAQAEQLQPLVTRLQAQLSTIEQQFAEEQRLRKKYHNQIQDMKGAIRVFCRFRPLVKREIDAGDAVAARKLDAFTVQVARSERESHGRGKKGEDDSKPFTFDSVFDSDSTQDEVFADCRELVQSAVDGYNVTIFAYGQTGAGKTFTMYGSEEHPGLAPRSIHALFNVMQHEGRNGNKTFKVKAYMIEVYKQDILDLLVDRPKQHGSEKASHLEVKRDLARGLVYVEGVTEREIRSPDELMATLADGEKRRHVSATKMNSASSRSHLLLSIIIECTVKDTEKVVYGKITLCDLAGSERPNKSGVSGDALKEAIEINKSLSALGDVIEALTKGAKSVPYRNHKLTMLMQDSLGGTAKTLMFVNCSPAASNGDETLMSLKWASRARQITNDVKRHADSKEVARLKQVIAMMSQAADAQEASDGARPTTSAGLEQVS